MLSGLRIRAVCADYSENNYRILGKYLKKSKQDSVREVDWREMDFEEEFDIILGDQPTQMIPYKYIPRILENCNRALKKDGICILRSGIRNSDKKSSLKNILAKNKNSRKDVFTYLWFPLFVYCCDFKTERMHVLDMKRELGKLFEKDAISEKDYISMAERIDALGDFSMNFPRMDKFKGMLKKQMKLLKVIRGNEVSPLSCIFVLKKKN